MFLYRILILLLLTSIAFAQNSSIDSLINKEYSSLESLYKDLHTHPELSYLPSLHWSLFAPVPEPTIKTGIKAMTAAVMNLMK